MSPSAGWIGYKITDIDRYARTAEPGITNCGAINAHSQQNDQRRQQRGHRKADLMKAVDSFGMPGFAPTQGHIPSGVPFIGHARDMILEGKIEKAMIVGKGSLFLGRLTNLFDGVSMIIEKNSGVVEVDTGFDQEQLRKMIAEAMRVLLSLFGIEVNNTFMERKVDHGRKNDTCRHC